MSQDINSDPEVWEMRETIGEKSLAIWLEFLAYADRNDGIFKGWLNPDKTLNKHVSNTFATRIKTRSKVIDRVFKHACNKEWIVFKPVCRLANYARYHKTRAETKTHKRPRLSLPLPNLPNLPKENHKNDSLSVREFVESWNEEFKNLLPIVQWPMSSGRQEKLRHRLKEHPSIEFWETVFTRIRSSPFLLGQKGGWKCTLDWLVENDANSSKVFEGQYDEKNRRS